MQMNWSIDRDGILKSLQIWNFTNLTSKTSSLHIRHSWQFLVDIFLRFSGVILSGKPLLFPFEFGVSLVEDQDLFIITYAQVFPFSKILVRIRNIVCLTFSLVPVTFCSINLFTPLTWFVLDFHTLIKALITLKFKERIKTQVSNCFQYPPIFVYFFHIWQVLHFWRENSNCYCIVQS